MLRTTQILVREMLFAGDSAIVAHSVGDIQSLVDRMARAASQFGLKINIKKIDVNATFVKLHNGNDNGEVM